MVLLSHRFKTKEDAIMWRDGLIAWKTWAIDFGMCNLMIDNIDFCSY